MASNSTRCSQASSMKVQDSLRGNPLSNFQLDQNLGVMR